MKNGKCPKCGSTNVFASDNGAGPGFSLHMRTGQHSLQTTDKWETYICTDCGFFENYVLDKDKLSKIAADPAKIGWRRVGN